MYEVDVYQAMFTILDVMLIQLAMEGENKAAQKANNNNN